MRVTITLRELSLKFFLVSGLALLITGCGPGLSGAETLAPAPKVTLTHTSANTPTQPPTSTSTLTPTITSTSTPQATPTVTDTPTATPVAGAYIQFYAFNPIEKETYCGLMTVDGTILKQQRTGKIVGYNMVKSVFCPDLESTWDLALDWSPDKTKYVFFEKNRVSETQFSETLYLGEYGKETLTLLGTYADHMGNNGFLIEPRLDWVGNHKILLSYSDWVSKTEVYFLVDVNNVLSDQYMGAYKLYGDRFAPTFSISPDGDRIVLQSWKTEDQSDFILMNIENGKSTNITQTIRSNEGISFPVRTEPVWSEDGSLMAVFGQKDNRVVLLILDRDGKMKILLDGGSENNFGYWANWKPDNKGLLVMCNPQSQGRYSSFDLCLINMKGEIENTFPYQKWWSFTVWSQWSDDGDSIYYLLKYVYDSYPAKLYKLDVNDGSTEMVFEGFSDRSWIQSMKFTESYEFSALWSPDGNWLILNDAGPNVPYYDNNLATTALLCNKLSRCNTIRTEALVVLGASWWVNPSDPQGNQAVAATPTPVLIDFENQKIVNLDIKKFAIESGACEIDGNILQMFSNGSIAQSFEVAESGNYAITIHAKGSAANGVLSKLRVNVNGRALSEITTSVYWEAYTIKTPLEMGTATIQIEFTNDLWRPEKNEDRNAWILAVRIERVD